MVCGSECQEFVVKVQMMFGVERSCNLAEVIRARNLGSHGIQGSGLVAAGVRLAAVQGRRKGVSMQAPGTKIRRILS
jgi:hypothetical protein